MKNNNVSAVDSTKIKAFKRGWLNKNTIIGTQPSILYRKRVLKGKLDVKIYFTKGRTWEGKVDL